MVGLFAVVRDPRMRAWSAWQSKLLIRDSVFYWQKYPRRQWLSRIPTSWQEIVDDFASFGQCLADRSDKVLMRDAHFEPQTQSLQEDVIPCSRQFHPGPA